MAHICQLVKVAVQVLAISLLLLHLSSAKTESKDETSCSAGIDTNRNLVGGWSLASTADVLKDLPKLEELISGLIAKHNAKSSNDLFEYKLAKENNQPKIDRVYTQVMAFKKAMKFL